MRQNCLDTTLDMNLGNVFYRNRESFYHRRLNEIVNLHVKLRDGTLCFFRFNKYSKQKKRQKH